MREQIVEAAIEQFHERGFNGAGVKDITDAAGVPKGSLYNHFDSKELLAVEAMRRYGASRRLEELARGPGAPLERLRQHFEFLRDEAVGYDLRRGCLLGNFGAEVADHNEQIRAVVGAGFTRWRDTIANVLRQAQAEGTVRAESDADTMAGFVLGAWEGALIVTRSRRTDEPLQAFFAIVFDQLLH
jgi:TetR/AcrR family transcriptional repressor of nem operon